MNGIPLYYTLELSANPTMTAVLPQQKPNPGEGTYTYSSQPRAVPQRKKFRNDVGEAPIDP